MKKILWKLIKSIYFNEAFKPLGFQALEFAFSSLDGKKYYRFPDALSIPLERDSKMTEFIYLYSRGLSPDSFDKLLDIMEEELTNGLGDKKSKAASKIGAIIHQMRWRKNMCVPVELLYNILAVQLIREDEKIEVFDNEKHMQKVEEIKALVAKYGCGFFLGYKELKMLFDFTTKSESEWREFWVNCQVETEVMKQVLKTLSYQQESEK